MEEDEIELPNISLKIDGITKPMVLIILMCFVTLIISVGGYKEAVFAKDIALDAGLAVGNLSITDHVPLYVYGCENGGFVSLGYSGEGDFGDKGRCEVVLLTLEDLNTLDEYRMNTIFDLAFGNKTREDINEVRK